MATEYKIRLNITYTYDTPAGGSRSVLRMLPRTFQGQKLVAGAVGCLPEPDYRRDRVDFFGNAVTELAHADPLSEVSFRFDGRVSMTPREDYFDFSSPLARLNDEIAQQVSLAPDAPHHYLGVSERIPLSEEIAAFAQDTVGPVLTALDAVLALSRGIHRTMTFDPTATDVTTTPVDAFRARSGVCQDYSHIMISGLRALGIPAGYVSGFLRTIPPEGKPRLEGPTRCMPGCRRGAGPRQDGFRSTPPMTWSLAQIISLWPWGAIMRMWPRSKDPYAQRAITQPCTKWM